jgi:hypothetical protein
MFLAQKRGTRFESLSSEPESVWGEALEEGRNVKGDKLRRASESGDPDSESTILRSYSLKLRA